MVYIATFTLIRVVSGCWLVGSSKLIQVISNTIYEDLSNFIGYHMHSCTGWIVALAGATSAAALPSVAVTASCWPECLVVGAMVAQPLARWTGPMPTSLVARPMALGAARAVLCGRWGLCDSCCNTVLYPKSVQW